VRDPKKLMIFGMVCLVLGSLSLRMHSVPALGEDSLDALRGALYGMAIGFNLLSVRMRCMTDVPR
jgi:hypothetical protein